MGIAIKYLQIYYYYLKSVIIIILCLLDLSNNILFKLLILALFFTLFGSEFRAVSGEIFPQAFRLPRSENKIPPCPIPLLIWWVSQRGGKTC